MMTLGKDLGYSILGKCKPPSAMANATWPRMPWLTTAKMRLISHCLAVSRGHLCIGAQDRKVRPPGPSIAPCALCLPRLYQTLAI